jgi:cupin superfamily acireductone dioxygenase involved in methionine salvage
MFKQVKNFKCLSCEVSYGNEKDIQQKITKFAPILGIGSNTFKPNLVQKFSRKRVYNALEVPICLYGSEIWTLRKKDKKLFPSIEIKLFRNPF